MDDRELHRALHWTNLRFSEGERVRLIDKDGKVLTYGTVTNVNVEEKQFGVSMDHPEAVIFDPDNPLASNVWSVEPA